MKTGATSTNAVAYRSRIEPAGGALLLVAALASACGLQREAASVSSPAATASRPLPPFRVTMLDVGTGLSILVAGEDFTLLYDAGSNDDRKTGQGDRAVAYLEAILGPSGSAACQSREGAEGVAQRPLDHVFLSHPHRDHVSFLPDVLDCFAVKTVWDSGAVADTETYAAFTEAASREPGVVYRSAKVLSSPSFREGDRITLGRAASAEILSVRPDARDLNDASIVVRLDLGRVSVLLEGDATGGDRKDPASAPSRSSVEAALVARHRKEIDVDVLQVGHHGSMTSSRTAFLDAVSPKIALVSAGPQPYGRVVLPDAEVIHALEARGTKVLRSDENDEACRSDEAKIGPDRDGAPGGCSAVTLRIDEAGQIRIEPGPRRD